MQFRLDHRTGIEAKKKIQGGILILASILSIFILLGTLNAADQAGVPKIQSTKTGPVLVLPQPLSNYIKAKFPRFRVPGPNDMIGNWAQYKTKKDAVPYACWGDFNGDGLTDVALILLSSTTWTVTIFHQLQNKSYHSFNCVVYPPLAGKEIPINHTPLQFYLSTVKAGQKSIIKDKESWDDIEYTYSQVFLSVLDGSLRGHLYHWGSATDSKWEEYRKYGFYGTRSYEWGD